MLKINRKLSRKGFTLVEVIVAVAILGMASLGIFQSYKVGFWGMSDARARTIATNIAQEKLEEIKGKSLADGTFPDPDNPIVVSGKNFDAVIDVSTIIDEESGLPTTLKKIIAKISWQKRNGEETNIQVEGLQSKALAPPSTDAPTAILISANPTEMDVGDTATIQVTILDQDNYPISFYGRINLSMIPNTLGTLGTLPSSITKTLDFNGESFLTTTFNANTVGDAGDVEISAEDDLNELIPDSVTITIIGGEPKSINLVVDPDSIIINGDTSVLTVRIEDEKHFLAAKWTGTIQLAIDPDQETGYLGDTPGSITITIDFIDQNIKTTLFTSSDLAGTAVITATDQAGVLTGNTGVTGDRETIYITSGPPYQIDITAKPNAIFIPGVGGDTSSTITVTIENKTGGEVAGFVGRITLSLLSGSESGYLDTNTNPLIFNGESSQSITFTSKTTPGIVEIEAKDSTSGGTGYLPLISDTETLTVAIGPPDHLEITALPDIILNDGTDSSTLTIVLKDSGGNYSSFDENKDLTFTLIPYHGTVNNNPGLEIPAGHSNISTTYFCNDNWEGDVNITVTCEGILDGSFLEGSTTVQVAQRIIRPSENPNIRYGGSWSWSRRLWQWVWVDDRSKVFFDIEILGGIIDITQIDLAWKEGSESEKLQRITIKDDASNVKINRTWSSWNYPMVKIYPLFCKIDSFTTNQDLNIGIYTVELDYNQNITNRTIIIQFYGIYEGRVTPIIYQLEFLSPDMVV